MMICREEDRHNEDVANHLQALFETELMRQQSLELKKEQRLAALRSLLEGWNVQVSGQQMDD